MMKRVIAASLCLLLIIACFGCRSTSQEAAQQNAAVETDPNAARFEEHPSTNTGLSYCLYVPASPTANMPLIVYLHGDSGRGSDLSLVYADSLPHYLKEEQLGDVRAYVLMPQLKADYNNWTDAAAQLRALILSTARAYQINVSRVSLTGHSLGGTGTWSLALSDTDLFSAIAPLSGSVRDTVVNLDKLGNMPVWAFVGSADTVVKPNSSESFVAKLKATGSPAEITVLEGAAHFDVPGLVYLDPTYDLIGWLTAQTK